MRGGGGVLENNLEGVPGGGAATKEVAADAGPAVCGPRRHGLAARAVGVLCLAAVSAGVLVSAMPLLWTVDPAGVSPVRGVLGFGVLLMEVFAFHAGLGLLVLGVVAFLLGRRRSAVCVLLLGVVHAGPGLVQLVPSRPAVSASVDDPGLTVLASNLLFTRADMDTLHAQAQRESPDVILLQEVMPDRGDEIRERFAATHPHTVGPTPGRWGTMILSRLPIEAVEPIPGIEPWSIGQAAGLVRVGDEGRGVLVVSTHLPAPTRVAHFVAGEQMAGTVADWIKGVRTGPDAPDAVILAGDFNAPLWTTRLTPLRDAGLIEAHAAVGAGRGSTWPAKTPLRFAPGIRLDQAAAVGSGRWAESRVLGPIGSDHRPIVARYVFE